MDREQIAELVAELEKALTDELFSKRHAVKLQQEAQALRSCTVLVEGYEGGAIDGKNADIRKAQEAVLLNESEPYNAVLKALDEAEREAALMEIKRKGVDATVGLTKAWLYSQSGR